jgi:hypothetical protein
MPKGSVLSIFPLHEVKKCVKVKVFVRNSNGLKLLHCDKNKSILNSESAR